MASYASQDDIDSLYGPNLLTRLTAGQSGQTNTDTVARALSSADALIDGYIGASYGLPLPSVPPILRECAVDIAIYRLCLELGKRTDEIRLRYEDAICRLKDISRGTLTLAFPATGTGDPATGGTPANNEKTRAARSFLSVRGA